MLLADSDDDPRFNHDGVHEIHRGIRSVLNDYPARGRRSARSGCSTTSSFAKYLRPDELHLGFNFRLVRAEFDAADIRGAIENSLAAAAMADADADLDAVQPRRRPRGHPLRRRRRSGWPGRGRWRW